MKKNLTPLQAYKLVRKKALENGMPVSNWAEKCGVTKSTISHWKRRKKQSTVFLSTLHRLGVDIN